MNHLCKTSIVSSLQEALESAHKITEVDEEIFIGGGMGVYADGLSLLDKLYITRVHQCYDNGGAFFPSFNWNQWDLKSSDRKSPESGPEYSFEIYQRKKLSSFDEKYLSYPYVSLYLFL